MQSKYRKKTIDMFDFKDFSLEKTLLLSLTISIMFVSSMCWGKIISRSINSQGQTVQKQIPTEAETVNRFKDPAAVIPGVMMMVLRHFPVAGNDD